MSSRSYSHYLFIDESGGIAQRETAHVVSCVVVTSDKRKLDQIVRFTRQRNKKSLTKNSFLHAARDARGGSEVVEFLLNQVAQTDEVSLVASILDKQYYLDRRTDTNDLYQKIVAYTVQLALDALGFPVASTYVVLENPFTNASLTASLVHQVSSSIAIPLKQVAVASKDDTEWGCGLQVADYVAWSLFQKYERDNDEYVGIIEKQIARAVPIGVLRGGIQPIADYCWK